METDKMIPASVIVPVYKAEKFLTRCLDSILEQSIKNFEVILIDDGSPDRSGKICDAYGEKDKRIRVFHQKNHGVTKTREIGIEKAQGKYIFWVDADDYINKYLLEKALNCFQKTNSDLVIWGWQEFQKGKVSETRVWKNQTVDAWKRDTINGRKGYLWDFAAPREFWLGETAPAEMAHGAADGYMTMRLFMKAKSVEVLPDILYYYERDNVNSVTHDMSGQRCQGSAYLWYYRWNLSQKICPQDLPYCVKNAVSGSVRAFSMGLFYRDLSQKEQQGLIDILHKSLIYPAYGSLRDRILRWGILHRQWWMCQIYANHKIRKEQKKKDQLRALEK